MLYLHFGGNEIRNVSTILLLRVSHQGQRAIVDLDDVLLAVLADEELDGANVQTTEQLGHVVHPRAMSLRDRQLLQHRRARVRLPVAGDALAPNHLTIK